MDFNEDVTLYRMLTHVEMESRKEVARGTLSRSGLTLFRFHGYEKSHWIDLTFEYGHESSDCICEELFVPGPKHGDHVLHEARFVRCDVVVWMAFAILRSLNRPQVRKLLFTLLTDAAFFVRQPRKQRHDIQVATLGLFWV